MTAEGEKPKSERDDFSRDVVLLLSQQVGGRCSNPDCRRPCWGPTLNSKGRINIGEAGHITAASKNGPRYDHSLTSEQRKSAENGIWLCCTCAKLIDSDPIRYTVTVLRKWKEDREREAFEEMAQTGSTTELLRPIACYVEFTSARDLRFVLHTYNSSEEVVLVESVSLRSKDGARVLSWRPDRPVIAGVVEIDGLDVTHAAQIPYNTHPRQEHAFFQYVDCDPSVLRAAPVDFIADVKWKARRDPAKKGCGCFPVEYAQAEQSAASRVKSQPTAAPAPEPAPWDVPWLTRHREEASKPLIALNSKSGSLPVVREGNTWWPRSNFGYTEIAFVLSRVKLSRSVLELRDAADAAHRLAKYCGEVGAMYRNRAEWAPKPRATEIVAQVAIEDPLDLQYWALRRDGSFYQLSRLPEDSWAIMEGERPGRTLNWVTRVLRTSEVLLYCERLYHELGVAPEETAHVRIGHYGLRGRHLVAEGGMWNPGIDKHISTEESKVDEICVPLRYLTKSEEMRDHLVHAVHALVAPLLEIFDFFSPPAERYREIVDDLVAGL